MADKADIVYRRLQVEDVALARSLNRLFADVFADDSYVGQPPPDDYLQSLLTDPSIYVLVALAGSEVIAGTVAYALRKLERVCTEIYVYDLAVAERFRRRGIARSLLRSLTGLMPRETTFVFVQADQDDVAARTLYASLGPEESVFHYDIWQAPPDPK